MTKLTVDQVQPYYRAYMLAHGMTVTPPPPHHEFLFWIQDQWQAWRAENGLDREAPLSEAMRKQFGEWLKAKTEPDLIDAGRGHLIRRE